MEPAAIYSGGPIGSGVFLNVLLVHYVVPPLMHGAVCLVRKMFVFGVV